MAIRVVLGEDHYLVREGVLRLLETRPEIEVAAACGDLGSLLAAVEEHAPDVVVTDIRMPPDGSDEGIQAAEQLRRLRPEIGVLVLSQYSEPRYALALLEAGTAGRGYLLKERVEDVEQLVAAIRDVSQGGSVVDPKVVESLVAARTRADAYPATTTVLLSTYREEDLPTHALSCGAIAYLHKSNLDAGALRALWARRQSVSAR